MATEKFISASCKSQIQYEDSIGKKKKRTYSQSNMASNATADTYEGLALAAQDCRESSTQLLSIKRVVTSLIGE